MVNPKCSGRLAAALVVLIIALPAAARAAGDDDKTVEALWQRIGVLENRLQRLDDINEIKNLQRIYGYYVDKTLWDQAADLFAADATLEIAGRGVFVGIDRIREYMHDLPALEHGRLFNHIVLQPVVHLSEDGNTANARARVMVQFGIKDQAAQWGGLLYENEYIKDNGVWKIKKLHAYVTYYVDYDEGWERGGNAKFGIKEALPPDLPPTVEYDAYPGIYTPPFHYPNPVTGRK